MMIQEQQPAPYSAIDTCHIGVGTIIVTYTTGCGYIYNSIKPGLPIVNKMIDLANQGAKESLNEYIKSLGSDNYYQKLE